MVPVNRSPPSTNTTFLFLLRTFFTAVAILAIPPKHALLSEPQLRPFLSVSSNLPWISFVWMIVRSKQTARDTYKQKNTQISRTTQTAPPNIFTFRFMCRIFSKSNKKIRTPVFSCHHKISAEWLYQWTGLILYWYSSNMKYGYWITKWRSKRSLFGRPNWKSVFFIQWRDTNQ